MPCALFRSDEHALPTETDLDFVSCSPGSLRSRSASSRSWAVRRRNSGPSREAQRPSRPGGVNVTPERRGARSRRVDSHVERRAKGAVPHPVSYKIYPKQRETGPDGSRHAAFENKTRTRRRRRLALHCRGAQRASPPRPRGPRLREEHASRNAYSTSVGQLAPNRPVGPRNCIDILVRITIGRSPRRHL